MVPVHLRDRGPGLATSQSGVYVRPGELLVFPSWESFRDDDTEYNPNEFGFFSPGELKGRYRASQGVLFLAYGWSDRLAVELEGAVGRATLHKAAEDVSGMPAEVEESGLGDVRTRVIWRWQTENGRRPELFAYGEVFFPHDKEKLLLGTPDWLLNGGMGAIRGFRWGTMTLRVGFKYDLGSASAIDHGEVAIEYLKRLSPKVTVSGGLTLLEGDEGSVIAGLQWHPTPNLTLRFNSGLAVTSFATDWAPEVGILFRFPLRKR